MRILKHACGFEHGASEPGTPTAHDEAGENHPSAAGFAASKIASALRGFAVAQSLSPLVPRSRPWNWSSVCWQENEAPAQRYHANCIPRRTDVSNEIPAFVDVSLAKFYELVKEQEFHG